MSLEIVSLVEEHLEDAALLVTARYRKLRQDVPSLPSRHEDVSSILSLLSDLASETPGVAAIRGGDLDGFLSGVVLPDFRGKRAAYSPEWANGAKGEDSGEIYREMYAQLSARWVADGCSIHAVTLLANDREGIEGWHWLGFGLTAVDAMRDLTPLQETFADVEIRRAQPEDIEEVMALDQALRRHLAAGPIFLLLDEEHNMEYHEQWLADPANVMWLAYRGAEVVACMALGPPEACYIIGDEKTVSIEPAFTKEGLRTRGIGTALLKHSVDWARSAGYERCAVDFEPENIPATRFWLTHFQPICYSLIRRVDERVM